MVPSPWMLDSWLRKGIIEWSPSLKVGHMTQQEYHWMVPLLEGWTHDSARVSLNGLLSFKVGLMTQQKYHWMVPSPSRLDSWLSKGIIEWSPLLEGWTHDSVGVTLNGPLSFKFGLMTQQEYHWMVPSPWRLESWLSKGIIEWSPILEGHAVQLICLGLALSAKVIRPNETGARDTDIEPIWMKLGVLGFCQANSMKLPKCQTASISGQFGGYFSLWPWVYFHQGSECLSQ